MVKVVWALNLDTRKDDKVIYALPQKPVEVHYFSHFNGNDHFLIQGCRCYYYVGGERKWMSARALQFRENNNLEDAAHRLEDALRPIRRRRVPSELWDINGCIDLEFPDLKISGEIFIPIMGYRDYLFQESIND